MLRNKRAWTVALLAVLTAGIPGAFAGVLLEPTEAPEWKVSEWINDPPGRLSSHRGKVVLINFFQLWCPGSREFSIPLFEKWAEEFGARDDVLVVSIHTVFEGHAEQTPEQLRRFVEENGITYPVGIDAYAQPGDKLPITMDRFETGGTPHVVIVDKEGEVRFSHFGRFDPVVVERFITRVLDEDKNLNFKSTPRKSKRKTPARKRPSSRRAGRSTPAAGPSEPPRPSEGVDDPGEGATEEDSEDPPEESPDSDSQDQDQEQDEDDESEPETPAEPDASLTGSYKLRFEQLAKSCGEPTRPIQVITQVTVLEDRIEANFSRAVLGIRRLTVNYDPSGNRFEVDLQQQAQERGGVTVDASLQISGTFVSIVEPPEVEYEYYFEETSEDGSLDCVIEGRGGGPRFRRR